jgi:hypothetical protein
LINQNYEEGLVGGQAAAGETVIVSGVVTALDLLPARMVGVIRRPRTTFAALKTAPRWADVLMITFLVTTALSVALLETRVGQLALLDQWERTAVAFGQDISDEQYAAMLDASENGAVYAFASSLASGPIVALGLAALFFAGFRVTGARGVSYRQVLSVIAHAGVILMLRQVIATPIVYARETLTSPATFSLFFTVLDEASPLARFLGVLDLFVIWWLVAIAIGISVLYGRSARHLALAFIAIYALLALTLALTMAVTGGTA